MSVSCQITHVINMRCALIRKAHLSAIVIAVIWKIKTESAQVTLLPKALCNYII